MGSLPTGSDKLLEIQSGETYVVIKSKNPHPNLTNKRILQQPSELRVTGVKVNSVYGLQLLSDGKYRFEKLREDYKTFLHCMGVVNAMAIEGGTR